MKVERVVTVEQLADIRKLLYRQYLKKTYCEPNSQQEFDEHPELDTTTVLYEPTRIVQALDSHGIIIGTVSMTIDGSQGLPTDRTFGVETQVIKEECELDGKVLGAVWRLAATDEKDRSVVGSLFDAVRAWMSELSLNVVLWVVHPRHSGLYRRCMGATEVARSPGEVGLMNAPAVLLRLDEPNFNVWHDYRRLFFPCE